MVDVKMLRPGTKLKVVDKWSPVCELIRNKQMDKYLGQVVTVLSTNGVGVYIEEDEGECSFSPNGHWYWSLRFFERIEENGHETTETQPKRSDFSFIFYNRPYC